MLFNLYRKLFLFLLATFVYFNIYVLANDSILVSIYPYLVGFTVLFTVFFIILQIFESSFIINITYGFITLSVIFFSYTFFQIWKNTKITDGYGVRKEKGKNPISYHNKALLLYDGIKMFDEIIEEIGQAKEHVHIEFFILRNDHIGKKFKDLLIKKAKEGVEVRLLYDGLGSWTLKKGYRRELELAGAQIKPYNGIWQSVIKGRLNHRNHRKIVIVDGKVGFTGGINIGDEYLGRDRKIGNWKDVLVKIEGEAVNHMQNVFLGDWYYITGEKLEHRKYLRTWSMDHNLPIEIVSGRYDTYWNEISQSYFSIITSAKERLYIATPYLVLSGSMISALQTRALKGVDIKIIIPKNPDHLLVGWANQSFLGKLLNCNIKIYLYEDGFLHSKVFVADKNIVSVGSANFNTRSLYLDYEMNAILYDENQVNLMIDELNKNIKASVEYTLDDYYQRSLIQRCKENIGKLFTPLI